MLEYKGFEHGCEIRKIDTFYPSSQTCSCCGFKNPVVKNLSVREWVCPQCGVHHDRDANAAMNILNRAFGSA
jgi:putative transposase